MTTVTERSARVRASLLVEPGAAADLDGRATRWAADGEYRALSSEELNEEAKRVLARGVDRLIDAQELLWATGSHALLVVIQAIDAAGKDSTIKHVMSGVNPQGVEVVSFRKPSSEELDHTFLWRITRALPARGRIGIFNRSHYEDVVALRVHPEWMAGGNGHAPDDEAFWSERYDDVNAFERHLARNHTAIVKLFLHVGKAEQKRRFLARLDRPHKEWKFNAADVAERGHWDAYMRAYEQALTATSTSWAPWYVIPADEKHVMQAMVATILAETIESLGLAWPTVSDETRAANQEARRILEAEPT